MDRSRAVGRWLVTVRRDRAAVGGWSDARGTGGLYTHYWSRAGGSSIVVTVTHYRNDDRRPGTIAGLSPGPARTVYAST